ncbi:MAG: GGDEF domain-containing response regulator [Acidobacteriota bacterium]
MTAPRILVVDDSPVTRSMLARTLEHAGFHVLQACDGIEGAVAALRECPQVVVTDLEMPNMGGLQLVRLLKSDPATAELPVLILTSHDEAASRYWSRKTGADAYLTKDYEPGELISAVSRLTGASRPKPSQTRPLVEGPLDVLARVVRHLDDRLMQVTLANALLEQGMTAGDLRQASGIVLELVAEVTDAPLLGIGVAEPEAASIVVLLAEPLSLRAVDGCVGALIARLDVAPGVAIDAIVTGQHGGDAMVDPCNLVEFSMPLRDAHAVLVVLPKDRGQFDDVSRPLVEAMTGHIAVVLDNARLALRLRELSTLDGLTRMLNHRAVLDRLAEELSRVERYHHPLSVLICDLDHFKAVNDTYGHVNGDAVLRSAAQTMRRALRPGDVLGRYGGEEFLAVLPDTDLAQARRVAERLRTALAAQTIRTGDARPIRVTASFGVAACGELAERTGVGVLVERADARLYEAKAAGRNCVRP